MAVGTGGVIIQESAFCTQVSSAPTSRQCGHHLPLGQHEGMAGRHPLQRSLLTQHSVLEIQTSRGASVFVYNSDQTEILGSFTEENNSELNLLPIQPIGGEELIVEYQEPLDASFPGEIEIGEVNHDFRGIFRATEPRDPTQKCHPNIVCYPEDILPGSGVVGLIINGTTYCTGSLTNNTGEDGTPYLLTATHCLNNDYDARFLANRKYDMIAGTIVAFFHYQSPLCSTDIRGPLQMTLASADSVLISERHDISLLQFKQPPPAAYQPITWDGMPPQHPRGRSMVSITPMEASKR